MPKDERRRPSSKSTSPAPSRAEDGPARTPAASQRIAKVMARAGLCSRRAAETWIAEGRVSVNGVTLTSPAIDIGADDAVLVDGQPLPEPERTRLFLFHKPRGLVTSDHDPEGRPTVADYLRENWPEGPRVMTIGRLDINTEGLLLLTNDGALARTLELPETGWLRRYRVRAKGTTDQARLDALRDGVTIDGFAYAGAEAVLDRIQGANCWLTIGLREGKNREVKKLLEHIELEVNRLIRLSFGPFQLLDLPEGAVEEVRPRVLRDQLGPTMAATLGIEVPQDGAPARAPNPPARGERPDAGRPARRDRSDGGTPEAAPPERRDRPAGSPRRHVSKLRTETQRPQQGEGRRRIERSATADRHDRPVQVERIASTRPPRGEMAPPRTRDAGQGEAESRPQRPPRRHASPSALGKRERIARSGPARPQPDGGNKKFDNRDDRKSRGPRDDTHRKPGPRPARDRSRPHEEGDRRGAKGRPNRTAFGDERASGESRPKRAPSRTGPKRPAHGDGRKPGPRPGPKRSGGAPRRPRPKP